MEVDDSLSYLMHATIAEKDPLYRSPLLAPFRMLSPVSPQLSEADLARNRHFSRVTSAYHRGHAQLLRAAHALTGWNYLLLWWCQAFVYNVLVVAAGFCMLRAFCGTTVALLATSLFGMSHLVILHQYTAAPREIAILGMLLALAMLRPALASRGLVRAVALTGVVAACLILCASVHPLGQALVVQFGAVAASVVYSQPRRQRRRGLAQVVICLVLAVLALLALRAGVPEPSRASWPLAFDPAPAVSSGLQRTASILIRPLIQLGFWGHLISGVGWGAGIVISTTLCAGALWLLGRRKRWPCGALALTTGVGHALLCYLGFDYQPGQTFVPLATYYATFSILVFAAVLAAGILALSQRFVSGRWAVRVLLTVAVVGTAADIVVWAPRVLTLETFWIHRQAYESPEPYIRALADASRSAPGCTAVDTEELLYAILTFGDYSRPVSYRDHCGGRWSFESGPSRDKCTLLLTTRECFDPGGYTTLREGDFVLAERNVPPATGKAGPR